MSAVFEVPIAQLATQLASLRGPRTDATSALAPLPVHVAPNGDGTYEVLDGFKRLAQWTRDGATHVAVVVEDAAGVVRKARLLEADAPRRTVSAMDEARVVRALHLSATSAHHLAALPRAEQPRLAETLLRHGLRTREATAFLEAWRVADDDAITREALLRDPRSAVPAPHDPVVSPLGPTARELQARFDHTERARGVAAARPHRLRRARPSDPGGLPAAPGRPGRPARPHGPGGDCTC